MKKRLLKILPIILVVICAAVLLTACVDADVEVQKQKLEGKGYIVHDLLTSGYNTMDAETAYEFVLNTTEGAVYARVYVLYFASDSGAIDFERNYLEYSEEEFKDNNNDAAKTYYYTRIGKIFIHGDERGYKDALS